MSLHTTALLSSIPRKIILTGDRPTGQLHLGHYVGSLENRVRLQHSYQQYVMIADLQGLTDHAEDPQTIISHVHEVAQDYFAVGIDPTISTIFIQSQVPELTELTFYCMNLVHLGRLERNPTLKAEIQQKGFHDTLPVGFLCYPISQAADITAFQAECVPVGEDQVPVIEQTNEIVRKFNRVYHTTCLKEAEPLIGKTPRLIGIDGKAKASKSLGNAILLADTPQVVSEKIRAMYTDPNHLKVSDPGRVEGNVVFSYLDAFHPDPQEIMTLKEHYQRGGLGDMVIKRLLNQTLEQWLEPIRERRAQCTFSMIKEFLYEGTQTARKAAQQTLEAVREAIGLVYPR